jgi:hypothetical protein
MRFTILGRVATCADAVAAPDAGGGAGVAEGGAPALPVAGGCVSVALSEDPAAPAVFSALRASRFPPHDASATTSATDTASAAHR